MLLYIYSGNSLRAVGKSMEVFNFVFPFLGLKAPSYNTVRDWVLKAGLDTYAHRCKNLPVDEAYAIVMDESIAIAEHKILLSLKTSARHPGKPLAHSDVEVIDIHAASSHNSIRHCGCRGQNHRYRRPFSRVCRDGQRNIPCQGAERCGA